MDHKVNHSVAVVKFIVIPGNELDKVILRAMPAPAWNVEEWDVTFKVEGDSLVFSIAQDTLEGLSDACLTTFLLSSYLATFSRK